MAKNALRACWLNCGGVDDEELLDDPEIHAIDAMADSLGPLDERTVQIRQLITGFEACYHEADREAEFIVAAIGAKRCPERSNERPPERKRALAGAQEVLSRWCEDPLCRDVHADIGEVAAAELIGYIGTPDARKLWQVRCVLDKITSALEPEHAYHNLALSVGDYGEPLASKADQHYRDHATFLQQTRETLIHDTLDGQPSKVSLAYAIDLLMPCGWDFVGSLSTILKAIGGDLQAQRPLACCARNIRLSPLCRRLRIISDALRTFWIERSGGPDIDRDILMLLGAPTPSKRWLAASLDKTIRLHLTQSFGMDLF